MENGRLLTWLLRHRFVGKDAVKWEESSSRKPLLRWACIFGTNQREVKHTQPPIKSCLNMKQAFFVLEENHNTSYGSRLLALFLVLEQRSSRFTSNASISFCRTKTEEIKYHNYPLLTKANREVMYCFITTTPTNNTTNTTKVVNDVIKVRPAFWLIDSLTRS